MVLDLNRLLLDLLDITSQGHSPKIEKKEILIWHQQQQQQPPL